MAKILLNVELGKSNVLNNLKQLESGIQGIGKSLGDVKINKNLTAQLNALTNNYKALTQAAKKEAIEKQKLIRATAQANVAKNNEVKSTIQLQTAQDRLTKAQESGTKVVKKSTEENKKNTQSILSMAKGFAQWQLAATLIMQPLYKIRQAWASLNETLTKTEDAVISIQRVLNDNSLDDSTISGKLYNLAQKYGQTFDNVNDIMQNFARTGMSWNETIQATEAALLALNVAELDATQASDGMIAIMQQFGKEASELTEIIDILNKTADNYAVTTDKLLTALQRTGSSAANANLSLEQTVGLITALSEATGRSGENLGTAINSLIQYSSKDSSLDVFASLDETTNAVVEKYRKGGATILEVWQAVSQVINNMDSRQEGILAGLANGEDIQNLEQELHDELGDIFETIGDVYGTANTFRKNYFIALLGNMDTVIDSIETASDASGYSAKENEKYLDTYTAKVNKLNAQWQELASNEQGFLAFKKGLVETGSIILQLVEWTGGLRTVVLALGTTVWVLFGNKLISGLKKIKKTFTTMIAEIKAGSIGLNSALGIIGIIATTISLVVGIIQSFNQAEKERREEAIQTYQSNKEEADSLLELYNRFEALESITNKTNEQQKEFNNITESIVENLGYEAYRLKGLEKGSADYLATLKEITQEKLRSFALDSQANLNAQRKNYNDYKIGGYIAPSAFGTVEAFDILNKAGYRNLTTKIVFKGTGSAISDYEQYRDLQNWLYDNGYGEHDLYNRVSEIVKKAESASIEYLKAQIEDSFYRNATEYGVTEAQNNFSNILKELFETNNISEESYFGKFLKGYGEEVFGIEEEKERIDTTKTWEEQIEGVLSNYEELLDVINKIRDTEQQINDIEEKRKALEDAKNNRTVRVYNGATGTWELQADQKAIKDAEKAYEDAVWKNVQSDIKDQTINVKEILEKISAFPQLTSAVLGWLQEEGYNVPDGLIFGTSTSIPSTTSGLSTNSNSTVNNNTTYTVNGIPITSEQAHQYTVAEVIEQAANMTD